LADLEDYSGSRVLESIGVISKTIDNLGMRELGKKRPKKKKKKTKAVCLWEV
jgi:hypothetical protein